MAASQIKTVDEYITGFNGEIQERLIKVRQIIKKVAPKADEMISYNMPLYKYDGRMLVSFAAWKTHIGMYPTPNAQGDLKKELALYEGAKSTLRFPYHDKLPTALIAIAVRLRLKALSK
jgi:uncharacterized protein YdhG (YjbR/CyaY superfamily)